MIHFWLFIRVALLKIKNARLRAENKILRDTLNRAIRERDWYGTIAITGKRPRRPHDEEMVGKYADAVRKSCR